MINKRFLSLLAAFLIGYAVANLAAKLLATDESEEKKTTAIEPEKAQQDKQTSAKALSVEVRR